MREANGTIRPLLPARTREEQAAYATRRVRGVTLAAIFDWSLASFLIALLLATAVLRGPTSRQAAAALALAIVGVPALLLLAEGLRRAREVARVLQLGLSSLVAFANVAGVLRDLRDLLQGETNPSTNLPSLVVGVFILWGLTRSQTIAWFAEVTPAEALRHHDLRWSQRVAAIGAIVGLVAVLINIG